jgi:hypothetical protein
VRQNQENNGNMQKIYLPYHSEQWSSIRTAIGLRVWQLRRQASKIIIVGVVIFTLILRCFPSSECTRMQTNSFKKEKKTKKKEKEKSE